MNLCLTCGKELDGGASCPGCGAPAHFPQLPESSIKGYKPEVIADSSGQWTGNSLIFATQKEAQAWVADLRGRWMLVRDTRVIPTTENPNYSYLDYELKSIN